MKPRARILLAVLLLTTLVTSPRQAHATGGGYEDAPPTLPWFLDRLPAKTPAQVFAETSARTAVKPTDFRAALRALAADAETNRRPAAALLATAEELLTQARLDAVQPAALCNLVGDVRDLFVTTPPVDGKRAAGYIRWRVDHAKSFGLQWEEKKQAPAPTLSEEEIKKRAAQFNDDLLGKVLDKSAGPLRAHWLYLRGASEFPEGGAKEFQEVIDEFPQHPRAEAARFMLARCKFAEARAHDRDEKEADAAADRVRARELFEDYLKRYPNGRFAADAAGWLGGLAFREGDYLGALGWYLQQADTPGHPEVLKSAGQMCERCLSRLSAGGGDEKALREIAARPKLAMSLIYLVVNTSETDNNNGELETPEEVSRWRRALLPRLAAEVAANESAYKTAEWQPRYLAILAQAASGSGDQKKALALCDMAKGEIDRNDDLAFIRLAALQRDRRLPEAIAAGRKFLERFPNSPLARGAALRIALALQDNHQAGLAIVELRRLQKALTKSNPQGESEDGPYDATTHLNPAADDPRTYPTTDEELPPSRSVLRHDATGAEPDQLAQIIDALLNFAPLAELAAGLGSMDSADAAHGRAVLAQRWLAEEENFAEARKYATPAQWSVAAAGLEKLAAAAAANSKNADALQRLGDGWAAARGKLVFAPLETDESRKKIFGDNAEIAGLSRRENGRALGLKTELVDRVLESRDELRHAQTWWLRAADAAPAGSAGRARALWLALRAMPSLAYASPLTWTRAGETDASATSRALYERLRRECPDSREAREFAVYYDFPLAAAKKKKPAADEEEKDTSAEEATSEKREPDPSRGSSSFSIGEPEYLFEPGDAFGGKKDAYYEDQDDLKDLVKRVLELRSSRHSAEPARLRADVTAIRAELKKEYRSRNATFLLNFVDDLSDFLQEDPAKLTPAAIRRYVGLRLECLNVEAWGNWNLPPVSGAPPSDGYDDTDRKPLGKGAGLDDVVLSHIRAAYKAPELAPFQEYLDFLAMAVLANHKVEVPAPGFGKEGQPAGSYTSRDYPKLAKLTGQFLIEHPRSRKREAAHLLHARALYAASRPTLIYKFAVWPESGHFASGNIVSTHRREPFKPRELGAALNAYDKEFPGGRYAGEIRNLRALLAWRTQEWPLALDLTLAALDDKTAPDLQTEAAVRLANIFSDGLTDDTERARLMAAIKTRPAAKEKLRAYLEKCDYPLRALSSWAKAQL